MIYVTCLDYNAHPTFPYVTIGDLEICYVYLDTIAVDSKYCAVNFEFIFKQVLLKFYYAIKQKLIKS